MLISIIMPAYNAEKYIDESIMSVINQTWKNWELLIIDDCSTDSTKKIINKYTSLDTRIRLLSNTNNQGVSYTRNKGIQESHGNWVAFLDSDDLWTPDKLSMQVDLINKTNALFTFTGSAFIDENGMALKYTLSVPDQIGYEELLKQNLISCSSVLISKPLLLSHPMIEGNIHEDFFTWLTILRDENINAYGVSSPALIYRIHSSSKSAKKWKAAIMNWKVYRKIGLSLVMCCYYQSHYIFRNVKKYSNIKNNK